MRYDDPDTPFSILIAGRIPAFRESVAAMFNPLSYRVSFAGDGKEAFDKDKAGSFDLVISAVSMDRLDGIELLNALRQQNPQRPVILVGEGTGEIEKVYLRCAALLGAARTFQHPLDPLTFHRNARAVILQSKLLAKQKV